MKLLVSEYRSLNPAPNKSNYTLFHQFNILYLLYMIFRYNDGFSNRFSLLELGPFYQQRDRPFRKAIKNSRR